MTRIPTPATIADAPEASRRLLNAVARQLGRVPNMFRSVALSPQALEGQLSLLSALSKATLPPATREAVRFAAKVATNRGQTTDSDFVAVKTAGYTVAQLIEIVLHVALNIWTNFFNEVFQTEIDFPLVQARQAI